MNSHGDERKISLKTELSPATAEEIIRLCHDFPLTVLKVTFWNNYPPWEVPERRINDNLGLFVDSGFLRFRTRRTDPLPRGLRDHSGIPGA